MRYLLAPVLIASMAAACTGTITAQPGYVTTASAAPRWQNPALFASRVRERMDNIERRTQEGVREGTIAAQALSELSMQRNQVEATLSQASADGAIVPFERDQVRTQIREMSQTGGRWRVQSGGYGWGGGPRSMEYDYRIDPEWGF